MGFKSLALAGAATAALTLGVAAPAMAHEVDHGGCHASCHHLVIKKNGVKFGWVNVFIHGHDIHGNIHVTKTMKPGVYHFKGHCKVHEHEHEVTTESNHETVVTRETRVVPSGAAKTGFGGASDQANLPLVAGALSIITGGIGLGGLAARRRLSGVRS